MNELNKKLWLETLREYCHCVPDAAGNMPCDNGVPCNRCYEPDVSAVYAAKLEAAESKQLSNFCRKCSTTCRTMILMVSIAWQICC